MTTECYKALDLWKVGIQYLHMVQAVANETYSQGNKHCIVSDNHISSEQYMEDTKWSDHNLVIPLLFNFYHGLEVIMKGFLTVKHPNTSFFGHELTKLLNDLNKEYGENELYETLGKYINQDTLPKIISDFLTNSNLSIDKYYQSLKYSETTDGNQAYHHSLKYRSEEGADFLKNLHDDIEQLRKEVVSLGREVCPIK